MISYFDIKNVFFSDWFRSKLPNLCIAITVNISVQPVETSGTHSQVQPHFVKQFCFSTDCTEQISISSDLWRSWKASFVTRARLAVTAKITGYWLSLHINRRIEEWHIQYRNKHILQIVAPFLCLCLNVLVGNTALLSHCNVRRLLLEVKHPKLSLKKRTNTQHVSLHLETLIMHEQSHACIAETPPPIH